MKTHLIKGHIKSSQTGHPLPGLRIEAWSTEALINVPLAKGVTDENGRFMLTFNEGLVQELLRHNPHIYFRIWQEETVLTGSHDTKRWNVQETTGEIALEVETKGGQAEEQSGIVTGTVFQPDNTPASGLTVKAFDKDLRSETALGEAITTSAGEYRIPYSQRKVAENEYGSADLLMRVYKDKQLLFETDINNIVFNAPSRVNIDIHLKESAGRTLSEYEKYLQILSPVTGKITLDTLEETKEHPDVTFLNRETGIDYNHIEYLALSYKIRQQFQFDAAFFYGLFREGTLLKNDPQQWLSTRVSINISSDVKALVYETVLIDADTIKAAITDAIAAHIIPDISKALPGLLRQLLGLQEEAKKYIEEERPQQLANLIVGSIKDGSYKKLVEMISKNASGNLPELLNNLVAANPFINAKAAKGAAIDINIASLLGTDETLIKHVKAAANIKTEKDVSQLAALSTDEWKEMLNRLPNEQLRTSMTASKDALHMHATILEGRFRKKYPHVAFMADFKRDQPAATDQLKKLPEIDLGGKSIDAQLKNTRLSDDTKAQLRSLQRLYKLTPDYNKARKLQADQLTAAYHIVGLGQKQFVARYSKDQTFTEKEATAVYQKAENIHTAAMTLGAELKEYAGAGKLKAFNGEALSLKIEQVSKDFPNLKSLFQEIDLCECMDCRSVYGPAAYLADVLQFLKNRLLSNGTKTAKDILFARRPDIGDIDLNCDNANTPIPYIDLVCEVLEDAVSPDLGILLDNTFTVDMVAGKISAHLLQGLTDNDVKNVTDEALLYPKYSAAGVDTYLLRDVKSTTKISAEGTGWRVRQLRQTHLSATELNAAPEYVNSDAYDTLSLSHISFGLPFDIYQERGNSLLEIVGVERADLMDTLGNAAGPDAPSKAAVYLKISPAERTLIVTADTTTAGQAIFWSTGALPLLATVQEVDVFLKKSGLSYVDLQQLLNQSFINPGNTLFIQHLDNTCDTAKKIIANLDEAALDRIHRFLRLYRKAGVSMDNLNSIIMYTALGNQQLNDATLVVIAALFKLQKSLGITLEQALSFYGQLPVDLYTSVYLNRIATNPIDEAFTIKNITANELLPVGTRDTLNAHLTTLKLSLKAKEDDITFLIGQLNPADITLTRDNLAFLYRHALLANLLGLKLPEMFTFSTLSALPLLTTPADTSAFVSSVRFLQTTGFTVNDLQWFLQNIDPTGLLAMQDATITTWLTALQTAYQKAFNTTRPEFNAALSPDENKNGVKQQMNLLPGLTAAVVDKIMAIIGGTFADTLTPEAYVDASLGGYFSTLDIQAKITALLALLPGDPGIPAAQNALIASLGTPISIYLFHAAKQTALYDAVQGTFGTTDVITSVLLQYGSLKFPGPVALLGDILSDDSLIDAVNTPPVPPAITPAAFDAQYRAIRLLKLMVSYLSKISIAAKDLQWFLQNNATMGWLEPDTLRYAGDVPAADFGKWVKWQEALLMMQNDGTVQSPVDATVVLSWTDVWGQVASGASQADTFQTLTLFTGWDATDVNGLTTWYGYTYPADFKLPATYLRLGAATAALRLLGVPVSTATQFIIPVLTEVEADLLTQALRNKYDDKQWLNVIQPVEDALRPRKRDALVAYLLAANPDLNGSNDLYDYFLMDVMMQPGQPSSRIVMAHGILQLFIQRCLMALEPNAIADVTNDDGWSQWIWMKNFQVWVANRKIFLYPENWIQPELRTDQSYFFADLISELQQNEITDQNVETAAIHYLEKLDDVASLDVRACYYDVSTYTMHVVARVRGGSTYYYRTGVKERKWEPWTKVDVDISGDHLLAYMLNNRLFLAWHLPTEEIQQGQSVSIPSTPINQAPPAPLKRYKIQLATSECINGVWQPKRTSQDVLHTSYYYDLNPVKDTFRMLDFDMGAVGYGILCTFDNHAIGMFNLTGCKGYPEVAYWGGKSLPYLDFIPDFLDTKFLQMQYRENDSRSFDTLSMRSILSPYKFDTILNATPGIFRITYPHEFSLIDWIYVALEVMAAKTDYPSSTEFGSQRKLVMPMASFMPFFYADGSREYVIIPGFFEEDGNNERTFSDIYKFVTDLIALVVKYIKILIADPAHDFNKMLQQLYADTEYIRLTAEWDFYRKHKPQLMFRNFYHPLVCYIKSTVYKGGLPAIMTYEVQSKENAFKFDATYQPQSPVAKPYPVENIDFDADGSYSSYNWELFYHLPFFIGNQLSQNQRFEEARKWYHYIFNPIGGAGGSAPQKYWITKPFHEFFDYVDQRIDTIMNDIASDPTGTIYKDLVNAVESWRENPFMPHEVARTRPLAYQKALLMKYLDNLIAWGDNLFMQNTMESLVQATQLYILADKLLGPKPMIIPPAVPVPDETYNQLEVKLDAFSNAMVDLENLLPDLNVLPHKGAELPTPHNTVSSLYFCIPANEQLLSYWDTIDDRLYKIRNSE
ncbi:neuraminidase-like domain-containing protein, partial [Chitinophaga sp.]|uniref:neuraminidase-like domain-containing protein n=1 Tax=Chitinophaga sp. TaxID=1869181 RepID=UPI002F93E347